MKHYANLINNKVPISFSIKFKDIFALSFTSHIRPSSVSRALDWKTEFIPWAGQTKYYTQSTLKNQARGSFVRYPCTLPCNK